MADFDDNEIDDLADVYGSALDEPGTVGAIASAADDDNSSTDDDDTSKAATDNASTETDEAGAEKPDAQTGEKDDEAPPAGDIQASDQGQDDQTSDNKPDVLGEKEKGLLAAAQAERDKRQQAEENYRLLQQQMMTLMQQQQANQQQPVAEQQEDEIDYYQDPAAVINQAVGKAVSQVTDQFSNQFLNLSENLARSKHDDFDDVKAHFFDNMVKANPMLIDQAKAQPDPYEYIYKTSKQNKSVADISDPVAYRERVRQEILAEIEAERAASNSAVIEKDVEQIATKLPGTLTSARAAGGNTDVMPDDSLETLYGHR